jgi:hypothetical protein
VPDVRQKQVREGVINKDIPLGNTDELASGRNQSADFWKKTVR